MCQVWQNNSFGGVCWGGLLLFVVILKMDLLHFPQTAEAAARPARIICPAEAVLKVKYVFLQLLCKPLEEPDSASVSDLWNGQSFLHRVRHAKGVCVFWARIPFAYFAHHSYHQTTNFSVSKAQPLLVCRSPTKEAIQKKKGGWNVNNPQEEGGPG